MSPEECLPYHPRQQIYIVQECPEVPLPGPSDGKEGQAVSEICKKG